MLLTISSLLIIGTFSLTFLANLKPINWFRLRVSKLGKKMLWSCGIIFLSVSALNAFSTFAKSSLLPLVSDLRSSFLSYLSYSSFYEIIIAGVIFLGFWIILQTVYVNKASFNPGNCKLFKEECYNIIASGIESDMINLANELENSIEDVISYANLTKTAKDNIARNANELLEYFSDEYFCKLIVKHSHKTLQKIFIAIKITAHDKNKDIESSSEKILIDQLIFHLFSEKNSILYRTKSDINELNLFKVKGKEFGLFNKIIDDIFGDIKFLNSAYRPLSDNWPLGSMMSKKEIDKYFDIIEYAIKRYIEKLNVEIENGLFYLNLSLLWCHLIDEYNYDNENSNIIIRKNSHHFFYNTEELLNSINRFVSSKIKEKKPINRYTAILLSDIIYAVLDSRNIPDFSPFPSPVKRILGNIYFSKDSYFGRDFNNKFIKNVKSKLEFKIKQEFEKLSLISKGRKVILSPFGYGIPWYVSQNILSTFGLSDKNMPIQRIILDVLKKEFMSFYTNYNGLRKVEDLLPQNIKFFYDEKKLVEYDDNKNIITELKLK